MNMIEFLTSRIAQLEWRLAALESSEHVPSSVKNSSGEGITVASDGIVTVNKQITANEGIASDENPNSGYAGEFTDDVQIEGGLDVGTSTGATPGQGFFSDKVEALTAFLNGAGTSNANNTAMSLYASVLLVQESGAANDQAQITLTFENTGDSTRNYAYAKMVVRVGYYDESTFQHLASIYKVELAQFDDGSVAAERYFNVTELCAAASAGGWTKPGVGGFAWASSSYTTFVFTIQNAGSGDADVDVQIFDGLNIASVAAALV